MTKLTTAKALVTGAALAGILAGTAAKSHATQTQKAGIGLKTFAAEKASCGGKDGCKGKHDCKGKNSCKGQGGCNSGDNGCKGKNSCKGKGGCDTKNPK